MANADNALKARLGKLKKKADRLGVIYQDDVTEETLKLAIEAHIEEVGDEPQESKGGGVTAADLQKMAEVIGGAIAKGNKETARESADSSQETVYEPDPEDLGELKIYYVPSIFWILPKKRIAGRLVGAPYNQRIVFKLDKGSAIQVGTQWQTRYISAYATDNKKIQAYMETHPMFKRNFFLSSKEANVTTDQVRYAQAFGRHFTALSNTMAPELYRRGAELGVNMSKDMALTTLRTELAEKLAQAEVERNKAQTAAIIAEQSRLTLLSQTPQ